MSNPDRESRLMADIFDGPALPLGKNLNPDPVSIFEEEVHSGEEARTVGGEAIFIELLEADAVRVLGSIRTEPADEQS